MGFRFLINLWVLSTLAISITACAEPDQSIYERKKPDTSLPTFTIEPYPFKQKSEYSEQGYPTSHQPTDSELMTAYPLMKMTDAAQVKTMTAMPTLTQFPPTSTATPVPTNGPLSNPLPAPIYFIFAPIPQNPTSSQIWRLERDGFTITQITKEKDDVDVFYDVSVDGRLAYISHNSLIITSANGENKKVLVEGDAPPPLNEQDDWYFDKKEIRAPSWSPDGTQIAFYRDGVNIIYLATGEIIKIVEGQVYGPNAYGIPIPENDRAPHPLPIAWTPDGSQIVLNLMGYETAATALVSTIPGSPIIKVDIDRGGCCDFSFTRDGQILFGGGDHGYIGLWLVNPKNGKAKNLSEIFKKDSSIYGPVVVFPKQTPDGKILFFTLNGQIDWQLQLASVIPGEKPFRIPEDIEFVNDTPVISGMLWFPDASRVIVIDVSNHLAVLDLSNGKISQLNIQAFNLHWGYQKTTP